MIHTMEQGSSSWFELRSRLITASDFPSIAHRAKIIKYQYAKARLETHLKSKFETSTTNQFMQRGILYEPIIMKRLLTDNPCGDNLIIQSGICMASYDFIDIFSNTIIEIKTSAASIDKIHDMLNGYIMQVYHQAAVLFDYLGGNTPLEDMVCSISLLRFVEDREENHIVDIKIDDHAIGYDSDSLELVGSIPITLDLWRQLCQEFYKELINYKG